MTAPNVESSDKGYLWRSLAPAAKRFYFRSRVRALLGLPDSGGVEMNFPQPLPFGGFTYPIPRFSGLAEVPDESIGTVRSSSRVSQAFLPDLATAPPRPRADSGLQSPSLKRPGAANVLSKPALSAPAKESQSRAGAVPRMPVTAEVQPKTSAGQRKTEAAPTPPPAPHPAERQAAIVADLSIPGRNEVLPALRREVQRRETPKKAEPASLASPPARTDGTVSGRDGRPPTAAGLSSDSATAAQPPRFAVEMPAPKDPPASPAGRPTVSTPSGVAMPPHTAILQSRVVASEAKQAHKQNPPSVPAVRTQSLLAKSFTHPEMGEAGVAPPRTEPRRASGNRRFAEAPQEIPADTPVTPHAVATPETPPIVIVNQGPETPTAAFWERRYLSHLHLRIRR
jgi:hypothetical protein